MKEWSVGFNSFQIMDRQIGVFEKARMLLDWMDVEYKAYSLYLFNDREKGTLYSQTYTKDLKIRGERYLSLK